MEPKVKFIVDYTRIETGNEEWSGVIYPTKADADWAADYIRTNNPNVRDVHVETIQANL